MAARPGLDVESAETLFAAVAVEVAEATETAEGVEADPEADPKPDVEPIVVCATADELFPPAELEALLTMPAAKEFKLAIFVFPAISRWFAIAANWLFGS